MLAKRKVSFYALLAVLAVGLSACQGMSGGARGGPGNAPVGSTSDGGKYGA